MPDTDSTVKDEKPSRGHRKTLSFQDDASVTAIEEEESVRRNSSHTSEFVEHEDDIVSKQSRRPRRGSHDSETDPNKDQGSRKPRNLERQRSNPGGTGSGRIPTLQIPDGSHTQERGGTSARNHKGAEDSFLHVIGEISGATGFGGKTVFCEWRLVLGSSWSVQRGHSSGCTHMASPLDDTDFSALSHPLHMTLKTQSVQGWPRVMVKVYEHHDYIGADTFLGYGICSLPASPGTHALRCLTWGASDRHSRVKDTQTNFFTDRAPALIDEGFVRLREEAYTAAVVTAGEGQVHLTVGVMFQGKGWEHMHLQGSHGGRQTTRSSSRRGRRLLKDTNVDDMLDNKTVSDLRFALNPVPEEDDDEGRRRFPQPESEGLKSVQEARGTRLRRMQEGPSDRTHAPEPSPTDRDADRDGPRLGTANSRRARRLARNSEKSSVTDSPRPAQMEDETSRASTPRGRTRRDRVKDREKMERPSGSTAGEGEAEKMKEESEDRPDSRSTMRRDRSATRLRRGSAEKSEISEANNNDQDVEQGEQNRGTSGRTKLAPL